MSGPETTPMFVSETYDIDAPPGWVKAVLSSEDPTVMVDFKKRTKSKSDKNASVKPLSEYGVSKETGVMIIGTRTSQVFMIKSVTGDVNDANLGCVISVMLQGAQTDEAVTIDVSLTPGVGGWVGRLPKICKGSFPAV